MTAFAELDAQNQLRHALIEGKTALCEPLTECLEDILADEGWSAACAYGRDSGREELAKEIEALWSDVDQLEATLAHAARPVNLGRSRWCSELREDVRA